MRSYIEYTKINKKCFEDGPQSENWIFSRWYWRVCLQAIDGAMNDAAYSIIRDPNMGWADCKSSNFITSCRYDVDHPAPNCAGFYVHWRGFGDLQAPELYTKLCDPNQPQNVWEDTLRMARQNVEACRDSFPGELPVPITPWVLLPGQTINYANPFTKDCLRRILTFLRGMQINEMNVWNDSQDPNNWNQFNDLYNQVWGASVTGASVVTGQGLAVEADNLRYIDPLRFSVAAIAYGPPPDWVAESQAVFTTSFNENHANQILRTVVEIEADPEVGHPVTCGIYLKNYMSGEFERIGEEFQLVRTTPNLPRQNVSRDVAQASRFIYPLPGGLAYMRVKCVSDQAFTSHIDIVQLVEANEDY